MAETNQQSGYEELEAETAERLEAEEAEQAVKGAEAEEFEEEAILAEAQDEEIEEEQLENERQQETALVEQEVENIREEGKSFGRPSLIKYFILIFLLAVPNDAIDTLEFTGFGAILSWLISLMISITSILFCWFTDHEQKRAEGYMKRLEALQARIVSTTRTFFKIAKFFRKNPTIKLISGTIAEMIPYVSILPWSVIAAIWAYYDERSMYKHAQKAGEELSSQPIEVV